MKTGLLAAALLLVAAAGRAAEKVRYFYDAAGRLTAAGYSVGVVTNAGLRYFYDANGNRTNLAMYAFGDTKDADADGMRDGNEIAYFGDLARTGAADYDGDGLVNSNEFLFGGDPTSGDTDGDEVGDLEEAIAGTSLTDRDEFFQLLDVGAAPEAGTRLTWGVKAGHSYQLQVCSNLAAGAWTDIGAVFDAAADGLHEADEAGGTNACYRTKVWVTP
ncbi:MAG: hypothetical protein KA248_00730 [Kiritimatiellae bacterium]|nr:hypothetical protein [Kiritimatiellia bacterium]